MPVIYATVFFAGYEDRSRQCQSAWAVTRKRNCHLTVLFYRLTARLGIKKALVVVAHQILVTVFHLLRDHSQ